MLEKHQVPFRKGETLQKSSYCPPARELHPKITLLQPSPLCFFPGCNSHSSSSTGAPRSWWGGRFMAPCLGRGGNLLPVPLHPHQHPPGTPPGLSAAKPHVGASKRAGGQRDKSLFRARRDARSRGVTPGRGVWVTPTSASRATNPDIGGRGQRRGRGV